MDVPISTTAEDRAWFNEEVSAVVEQDNRAWLDTMLEMKREELVNYAVFQYGLPAVAAEASGRNDLISLIVVANKAGGGQSVSNQTYFYIKELKGILEPAVSLFKAEDDPLFLVRGTGAAQQVYDKINDRWISLELTKRQHAQKVQETKQAATEAAASVAAHPSFEQPPAAPVAPSLPTLTEAVVDILPTLKRSDLNKFALELGIEDGLDQEKYAKNGDLVTAITAVNEANRKG